MNESYKLKYKKMKCFTKISLVLLSCFSIAKGAVLPNDNSNVDLSSLFANLLEQKQTPAVPVANNDITEVAGVTANPNEIDDTYTQDDIRKYTKFLLNFVNNDNSVQSITKTTATTTTTEAATTSAATVLNDIRNLSSELDQIKERRVGEIDELIDIIKSVSQRLEALEDTVEQTISKQEIANTVDDTKEVDLNNAEVDSDAKAITPINENDLKYAAIFNAFNQKNEEKIVSMQEDEIKLLKEIKELLSNNANVNVNADNGKAIVNADKEEKEEEVKPETNDKEDTKDEVAKETNEENKENTKSEHVISIEHAKKVLNEIASNTTNEQQVDEVQRIIKEIQLNQQAEINNLNEEESVGDALFKVSSNTVNEEQVEDVRDFIKSIEAKAIVDDNLKKDEVIKKLIYDIAANTTNEEQVHQIQRIIEKIQLYNKFAEDTQQEREDNIAFGHEMAAEIVKTPEEINNDLKVLLVNLVDNAKTEEEAANVANIITQIKKHDQLIKEKKEQDEASKYIKTPHVETYMIDLDDGSSNQIYLKENQEFIETVENNDEVKVIDLEEGIDEEDGNGKGMFILGAFGVVALASVGYTYRSRAKKLNEEFPFSDNNLPFSNSMNGLVVDKNFLLRKNSVPKPDNIINNDAVIRPSQPSWATSVLMDENNKKGLKENLQITEDPEQLLDEQLREIESKEKVIVKSNLPSVVITIDENNATTEVIEAQKSKQKKTIKKPKLRRSMSHISLDKKINEDREENSKKERKTKSLYIENSKTVEEGNQLDENTELYLNTSFILDANSKLFGDKEIETEKVSKKKSLILNTEKPKVPKRVSSCLPESNDILPSLIEEEEKDKEELNENSECQFSQEFAKELMEDYNKKFDEMEKEN
ncbi:hypothetical protein H8356DRAFT_1318520 [Neocallimastix lanati (nom. inval.)]|nr:hypothetical protein H8356DRAFT_1318520 [Neocallimastix sp. JGI-2020a]